MTRCVVWMIVGALCATPVAAAAQSYVELVPPRHRERIYIVADAGVTWSGKEFAASGPIRLSSGFTGTTRWEGTINSGPTFGAGGGVMLSERVGLGVTATRTTYTDLPVTFTLLWPSAAGRPETGYYFGGSRRKEDGVHVEASYMVYRGRSGTLRLFGGPTLYRVKQSLDHQPRSARGNWQSGELTTVEYRTSEVERWGWGYHAGLDAAKYFGHPRAGASRKFGVGATLRYMGGRVEMDNLMTSEPDDRTPFDVGGLQLTAGLRLAF